MKIIGITGGVGAGKSTVLKVLEKDYQAFILQADQVGHLVMEPEGSCYERVIALFGKKIVKEDKSIDRRAISDVVFEDESALQALNEIIHPAVKAYIKEKLAKQEQAGCPLAVVEAALLFEDHYEEFCHQTWYIHTDTEIRICRLMESRGYSREKALSIIHNQKSDDYYRSRADYVIENNGSFEETKARIQRGVENL